ncbi:unnamed protein product [Protopolystoma xenopodis]|uniref:Uncharacterized protein n=1 Tax=Protopolystoma xenopodis TaxID=117903 RepID=A0A3S5CUK3_9PLAT|nr:unnamed protein product [Protopolystoma xenopodis]
MSPAYSDTISKKKSRKSLRSATVGTLDHDHEALHSDDSSINLASDETLALSTPLVRVQQSDVAASGLSPASVRKSKRLR